MSLKTSFLLQFWNVNFFSSDFCQFTVYYLKRFLFLHFISRLFPNCGSCPVSSVFFAVVHFLFLFGVFLYFHLFSTPSIFSLFPSYILPSTLSFPVIVPSLILSFYFLFSVVFSRSFQFILVPSSLSWLESGFIPLLWFLFLVRNFLVKFLSSFEAQQKKTTERSCSSVWRLNTSSPLCSPCGGETVGQRVLWVTEVNKI